MGKAAYNSLVRVVLCEGRPFDYYFWEGVDQEKTTSVRTNDDQIGQNLRVICSVLGTRNLPLMQGRFRRSQGRFKALTEL